jgi:hypothetical protein
MSFRFLASGSSIQMYIVCSFVLILTRDNGSEPKKVCKRCDDGFLRVGRMALAFYRRGYTLLT